MSPSQHTFTSVLWLDDQRQPLLLGVDWVRNYEQFVWHLKNKPDFPELVSFDHDLAFEHYPLNENRPGVEIPYDTYKEKTGLEAAKYIVENGLPLKFWAVHSFNVTGRMNIEAVLRAYRPQGEIRDLKMPYWLAN